MRSRCLFVINLVFLLPVAIASKINTTFRPISRHASLNEISLLEEDIKQGNNVEDQKKKTDSEVKPAEPLNLIFSPTAQQVSDENNQLLESMESGLHSLRTVVNKLTRLVHLLPENEKQSTFTVGNQNYTVAEMLDGINSLIVDGEKQQRVLVEGTAEILHKLAAPIAASQTTQAS
ncbi:membrane protein, putative [Babesia bigemina]|uniref:Membrane protein, putative n=1 Tax=Babesia bigemina TaxID=5866 RepID=A0A061D0M3_BABBI|nr:membrane protein, putative [Babesia bigemina]CDR94346.1 membrane protein, putative [Babesia bigemina]|eukprot:XP_012766532.1 membrane protein, putative [Babesia bigemina]